MVSQGMVDAFVALIVFVMVAAGAGCSMVAGTAGVLSAREGSQLGRRAVVGVATGLIAAGIFTWLRRDDASLAFLIVPAFSVEGRSGP